MKYLDKKQTKDRKILDLESLGFNDFLVVGNYNYKSVKSNLETHVHTGMIEIMYLAKGRQYYQIANKEYMLQGGDILVIPSDTAHGTSSYPEDIGSLYWMVFRIPPKNSRFLNLSPNESQYLIDQFLNLQVCHFKGNAKMASSLSRIFKYYDVQEKIKSKIRLTSLVLQFVLDVIDASNKNSLNHSPTPEILKAVEYINGHLHEGTSIDGLADLTNLSVSRFKHRFKKELGIPPGEFIMRQKIDYAKNNYGSYKSIQSLAFSLGFSSSNYFASVFKKFTGSTPSDYFGNERDYSA
jgi:AraC-like DNA-binding protein